MLVWSPRVKTVRRILAFTTNGINVAKSITYS
jgi:hypothetical protein